MSFWILTSLLFAQDPRQDLIEAGKKERSILQQIESIDINLQTIREEQQKLEENYRSFEEQKNSYAELVAFATIELQSKKNELNTTLRALYKLRRRGLARIVFGAESPIELRRRSNYLLSLVELSTQKLDAYKEALEKQKTAQKQLSDTNQKLSSTQETLLLKTQELEQQKDEKQKILKNIRSQKSQALQLLSEINRSQKNLQEQIPVPQKTTSATSFSSLYGKLPWPVKGTLIRRFGKQKDPSTQKTIENRGIDIEATFGSPVRSVAGGQVILAEFIPAYGMTIAIQHGSYSTIYAHLNGLKVRKGQSVRSGTVIGYVGNTGLTDTTNRYVLGFEVRKSRIPQDPLPWLRRR